MGCGDGTSHGFATEPARHGLQARLARMQMLQRAAQDMVADTVRAGDGGTAVSCK